MIVTLPDFFAVTKPVLLTVSTLTSLLLQVKVLSVAFDGCTVAVNCCVFPTSIDAVDGLTLMPVTPIDDTFVTRIDFFAFFPFDVLTVIVTLPVFFPLTSPLESMVATDLFEEAHVTD